MTNQRPTLDGPRINERITVSEVRLIDETGENVGVVSLEDGQRRADAAGLDLVEIVPNSKPPVVKIMDYGKFKYQEAKKKNEAKKKQKVIEIKEVKVRPNIEQHDFDVKMRNVNKFIREGNKVKVTLRFRGREMAHQELGMQVLHRVREEMGDLIKVEHSPSMEGRQMIMVLAPK